ncbi:MAG: calcium/sodium antiporter [Nitrosopumilus sp.]|jgi:cation:H+ antiporter
MDILLNSALVVVGIAMLCFGGNWLVSGGVKIAKKLRISNLIIGMTVVAYGTSTPELAASIAAGSEHSEIILGNVIGSNITNIGLVVGIAAIMLPLMLERNTIRKEIPIMIGVSFLLIILSLDGDVSIYDGILLLAIMIGYTVVTIKNISKQRNEIKEEPTIENNFYLKSFGLLGIGIILLYFGSILTVDNAVILAKEFGLSEKVIGLTVIAIGTSLPELITSVIAIRKGHTDIGVGNIVGSNLYNILLILGLSATIGSIAVSSDVFIDYAIMIGFSLALMVGLKTKVINRKIGIGLTIGFVAYMVLLFFK